MKWPRPSGQLLLWLALGLLPAALGAVVPGMWRIAVAVDMTALAAYGIDILLWRRSVHIEANCELPTRTSRGKPFVIRYVFTNTGKRPVHVQLQARLPNMLAPTNVAWDSIIAPGHAVAYPQTLVAQRRGTHTLPPAAYSYRTPLGFADVALPLAAAHPIQVLPSTAALQQFDALVRLQKQHEMGVVRSRDRGDGGEISGLRPYRTGDPLGRIDWKATARHGALISREVHAEHRQQVVLLMDCGRRMAREIEGRSRLDQAVESALLLAHVALRTDDRVGLVAFSDVLLRVVDPVRGHGSASTLAHGLFDLEPTLREPPYQTLAAQIARRVRRRALFVLFTDASEPAALAQLVTPLRFLSRSHLVVCVLFTDAGLHRMLHEPVEDSASLYRLGAAADIAVERSQGLRSLRHAGALVVQAPPERLSAAVINQYLKVKARRLL